MSRLNRLEALIMNTVNWTFLVNDGGGDDTVTLTAGSRHPTEFLAALKTALDSATGDTWTVTMDAETGIVTITTTDSASITWTGTGATTIRDILGFIGDLATATSFVGVLGMQGVWIPKCAVVGPGLSFAIDGHLRTDTRQMKGPTGHLSTWSGNNYRSFRGVRWPLVPLDRALDGIGAAVSWQQFVRQSLLGGAAGFVLSDEGIAPTVKWYADATTLVGTSDGIYALVINPDLEPLQVTEGWGQRWTVEIPELVKVT